jgi:hypothetical protein
MTVNGTNFTIAQGASFGFPIIVGRTFCFVFNTGGFITGCLSSIVTGLPYNGAINAGKEVLD